VSDNTAPSVLSVAVEDAAPTKVVLTFSETPVASALSADDFAIVVDGAAAVTPTSASIVGNTIELTSSEINDGDVVMVNYVPSGTSGQDLADAAGNAVAGFTDQGVTNNVGVGGVCVCGLVPSFCYASAGLADCSCSSVSVEFLLS
jgi:hypothetical protein